MTYRRRPDREALVLAAVDLAMSEEAPVDDRPGVLALLLEALGVRDAELDRVASTYGRSDLAEELVELALILDEADVSGVDGAQLRAACRPDATLAQREAELDHIAHRFDQLVAAAVESLPPSTIRRP